MMILQPYLTDYKSQGEIRKALKAEKDFFINDMTSPYDGKPANLSSLLHVGITEVQVRYFENRKSMMVNLEDLKGEM